MRRLIITRFGGPEVLEWEDAPEPEPGPGEVLVRTATVSVNWADLLERQGRYPGQGEPPLPVGHDIVGVVEALGEGVEQPAVGTRVCGVRPLSGTAADLVTMPADWVFPVPAGLSDIDAAGFVSSYFTADGGLITIGRMQPGESVLVHAAAGALGSATMQMARSYGASLIIGTAGSDEKVERVRQWGADVGVNYRTEDFVDRVAELTDGRGVDLVVDSVGGEVLGNSFDCVAPAGRIVTLGASSGESTKRMRIQTLFDKGISIGGFTLGLWFRHEPQLVAAIAERVFAAQARGDLTTSTFGRVFPADQVVEAHRYVGGRESVGRTVIDMRS